MQTCLSGCYPSALPVASCRRSPSIVDSAIVISEVWYLSPDVTVDPPRDIGELLLGPVESNLRLLFECIQRDERLGEGFSLPADHLLDAIHADRERLAADHRIDLFLSRRDIAQHVEDPPHCLTLGRIIEAETPRAAHNRLPSREHFVIKRMWLEA